MPKETTMNLSEKKPKDVIKSEFLEKYNELHKNICFRLSHINTTITILEKILESPLQYFQQSETIFWQTVCWNSVWLSVVLIHALINENGKNTHTLLRFKNDILLNWLEDSEKAEFRQILKEHKFDQTTKTIIEKIKQIRNEELAHRLFDGSDRNHLSNAGGIKASEIRRLYNDIENLFRACNFGIEYDITLYPTGTCGGKPIEKDIDKLLDLIVKNSNWLNQPKVMEEGWPDMRRDLSKEELRELNTWRAKFNLPPA